MNSIATSIVIIPGVVALLLCLLFTYLYQQSRQAYFRAWQIAWACYAIHYALDALRYYRPPATAAYFFSSLFSVAMAVCIFGSTHLMQGSFRPRWYDWGVAAAGFITSCIDLRVHLLSSKLPPGQRPLSLAVVFLSATLLYSSAVFYLHAHRKVAVRRARHLNRATLGTGMAGRELRHQAVGDVVQFEPVGITSDQNQREHHPKQRRGHGLRETLAKQHQRHGARDDEDDDLLRQRSEVEFRKLSATPGAAGDDQDERDQHHPQKKRQ